MIQSPVFPKPDCNAVKIEINNPTVNAQPTACPCNSQHQAVHAQPQYYYAYPQTSVYSQGATSYQMPMQQQFVPVQTIPSVVEAPKALPVADTTSYINATTFKTAEPVKTETSTVTTKTETTAIPTGYVATIPVYQTFPSSNGEIKLKSVPDPVITEQIQKKNVASQTVTTTTTSTTEAPAEAAKVVAPVVSAAPVTEVVKETKVTETPKNNTVVEEKTVTTTTKTITTPDNQIQVQQILRPEIVGAETITPKIDIDKYCNSLSTEDFEAQYKAMRAIKDMVRKYPQDSTATSLVDIRVYDRLYSIVTYDTSKLAGPSAEQIAAREKINKGMNVTDKELLVARSLSPKEYAEHNKSIAMFTMASLDKLMIDVLKNEDNINVPLVDIPFANAIADEIKDNPNPIVRASAIESLSWIQQPEYKNELKALFTAAANDKDSRVADTAKTALDKLNNL